MCERGVNEKYSRNGRSGPGYIGRYAAVKQNSTRGVIKTRRVKHRLWHSTYQAASNADRQGNRQEYVRAKRCGIEGASTCVCTGLV